MKAITLVALVVTIVVLIILATVAIQLSLGNNGIFNRAKIAKEQYQNSESYEQTEIAKTSNQIDSYVDGNRTSGSPSNNYSLDEQVVGTWIDGKPLYQKTIDWTCPTTTNVETTANGANLVEIPWSDVDTLIDINGCVNRSDGWITFLGHSYQNSYGATAIAIDWNKNKNKFFIYAGNLNKGQAGFLTFYYTKTTDQ